MRRRSFLAIVVLAVAVGSLACGGGRGGPLERGDPVPPFALETLEGPVLRFPEGLAGRGVIVRFWAAWCRSCEGEMKEIDPIAERLAASGVSFVAVNVGQDRPAVEAFARRLGIRFPMLLDEPAATAKAWGVKGLPTTFFVGPEGRVRRKLVGAAEAGAFERFARELVVPGERR